MVEKLGPLVRYTRDPLFGMTREGLIERYQEILRGRAVSAWLFGSITGAGFNKWSDVDLIVMARTDKPFLERPRDYEDLFDLVPALDLLVYTPGEFAELTGQPSAGFWSSVVRGMQRIL